MDGAECQTRSLESTVSELGRPWVYYDTYKESQIDGVASRRRGCVMRSAVIVVFGGREGER